MFAYVRLTREKYVSEGRNAEVGSRRSEVRVRTEMNAQAEIFSRENVGHWNEAYSSDEHSSDSMYLNLTCAGLQNRLEAIS